MLTLWTNLNNPIDFAVAEDMDNKPSSYLVPQKENTTDVKSHIPEQLIYEMLICLPVKSLCRFKCVSKSLGAFIDTQLKHKIRRKLLFQEGISHPKYTAFRVCDIDDGLEQKIIIRNQQERKLYLLSDYNGLFLLSDGLSNFVLWNPCTRQYRNILACPLKRNNNRCKMGLGYDSVGDDYKVVLIDPGNAWIFGLRSNSWKSIDFQINIPHIEYGLSNSAYFAHGNLHWLHKAPSPSPKMAFHEQKIFAFDVTKEKFFQVVQPDYPTKGHISDLYVLDECLCISFFAYTSVNEVHLYVSNDDGDEYAWRNLCLITFHRLPSSLDVAYFNYVKIVGYSKEGNKVLLDIGKYGWWDFEWKYMISYDLKRKILSKVDVPDEYKTGRMFDESLVSVSIGAESINAWRPFREEFYDETEL